MEKVSTQFSFLPRWKERRKKRKKERKRERKTQFSCNKSRSVPRQTDRQTDRPTLALYGYALAVRCLAFGWFQVRVSTLLPESFAMGESSSIARSLPATLPIYANARAAYKQHQHTHTHTPAQCVVICVCVCVCLQKKLFISSNYRKACIWIPYKYAQMLMIESEIIAYLHMDWLAETTDR